MRGVKPALGLVGVTAWSLVMASTVSFEITSALPAPLRLGASGWAPTAEKAETTVVVQAEGEWEAASDQHQPWLTVSPKSGVGNSRITLSAAANYQAEARWATVSVIDAGSVRTVTVSQAGQGGTKAVPLNLEQTDWDVSQYSGTTTVRVGSDRDWTVESDQPWVTVEKVGPDALVVSVVKNTGADRSAIVRVNDGTSVRVLVVNQAGRSAGPQAAASLQVEPASLHPGWEAGQEEVLVSADGPWSLISDVAWITGSELSSGAAVVTWAANPDSLPRTGTLRVTSGGITRVLQVDQEGQVDRYAPEGVLEKVMTGRGQVRVQGWVLDRDQPSANVPVEVYVKTDTVGLTFVGNGMANRPGSKGQEFDLTVQTELLDGIVGRYEVCVYAKSIPSGAGLHPLGCITSSSAAVLPQQAGPISLPAHR